MELSHARLAANQANAQLSTGPATSDGKARTSQNARTHGLTSKHLKISEAGQPIFDSLHDALKSQLAPVGELELLLTDRIIRAHWDLRTIDGLEADLLSNLDPFNDKHSVALNRFSLYRARTENSLAKAHKELRALQEERFLRSAALNKSSNHNNFPPLIRIAHIQRDFKLFGKPKNQTHSTSSYNEKTCPQA